MCSVKVREKVRFCWNCNADQSKYGPVDWAADSNDSTGTGNPSTSSFTSTNDSEKRLCFGRPISQKIMSLNSFMETKSSESRAGSEFRPKKKQKLKDNKEEVTISIGIKNWMKKS